MKKLKLHLPVIFIAFIIGAFSAVWAILLINQGETQLKLSEAALAQLKGFNFEAVITDSTHSQFVKLTDGKLSHTLSAKQSIKIYSWDNASQIALLADENARLNPKYSAEKEVVFSDGAVKKGNLYADKAEYADVFISLATEKDKISFNTGLKYAMQKNEMFESYYVGVDASYKDAYYSDYRLQSPNAANMKASVVGMNGKTYFMPQTYPNMEGSSGVWRVDEVISSDEISYSFDTVGEDRIMNTSAEYGKAVKVIDYQRAEGGETIKLFEINTRLVMLVYESNCIKAYVYSDKYELLDEKVLVENLSYKNKIGFYITADAISGKNEFSLGIITYSDNRPAMYACGVKLSENGKIENAVTAQLSGMADKISLTALSDSADKLAVISTKYYADGGEVKTREYYTEIEVFGADGKLLFSEKYNDIIATILNYSSQYILELYSKSEPNAGNNMVLDNWSSYYYVKNIGGEAE